MSEPQAAAPASPPGGAYRSVGKVEAIDKDEIMLSHEPIPALKWPSMTMAFKPPAGGLPSDLKVGDKVDFEFRQGTDGRFEISAIGKAKQ